MAEGEVEKDTRKGKKDYSRMYFRYESIEEVKGKFRNGDVLAGLTTKIDDAKTLEGHFWITYGKRPKNQYGSNNN